MTANGGKGKHALYVTTFQRNECTQQTFVLLGPKNPLLQRGTFQCFPWEKFDLKENLYHCYLVFTFYKHNLLFFYFTKLPPQPPLPPVIFHNFIFCIFNVTKFAIDVIDKIKSTKKIYLSTLTKPPPTCNASDFS
jgi:hypothetical protein